MGNSNAKPKNKLNAYFSLAVFLVVLLFVNFSGHLFFKRFDLTTDNRYSLNEFTKNQLSELEDVIFLRIYLDGDLPSGFMQLHNSTKEILDEMRVYAGDNLQYEFIDPSENPDEKVRQNIYRELSKKGLQYSNLTTREGDKMSEQIVFPGAILAYREKEYPIQLLKNTMGTSPEAMLNNSIQQLEYEISSVIKKATTNFPKKIAFITGHGEADRMEVQSISRSIGEFYKYDYIEINGQINALAAFDAALIVGPDSAFTEKDKYVLDQFIMNGGKTMWFIENAKINIDSLRKNGISLGLGKDLNLNDQLFKYGARVNPDFVMDVQSLPIPIVTGMTGDQPKQELFPWYYFPLVFSSVKHPITANLDAIATQYVGSIDTVGGKNITKTPLLFSSDYSKLVNVPTRVALNILRDPPDERRFNKGPQMISVLLEGKFESVFKNRVSDKISSNPEFEFMDTSPVNKMIIVSDADIIKNDVSPDGKKFFDLGYYRYTKRMYGNKEFILNSLSYLLEDDGLIFSRVKEFKLRLLNKQIVVKEKRKWQIFNTAFPILFIVIIGVFVGISRKRKYSSH
ncbi:MAG: ABC-2 type transport system permease protein [Salibacteraceae bacterium]|jgi:ABC-2 type transport system permease protein